MRVLIYTQPQWANYGGILQAYALQMTLERMGHSVTVSSCKHEIPVSRWMWSKAHIKRLLGRGDRGKKIFDVRRYNEAIPIVEENTQRFVKQYIHQDLRAPKQIKESDYDAIVVGSDQVWRPMFSINPIMNSYLDFAKDWNIKRLAYSASFGTDEWEYSAEQTKEAAELIKKFDAVSVREASAVSLCKEYLGVDAVHLLDPTMLLDRSEYEAIACEMPKSNGELFAYVLDNSESKTALIDKIAKDKGMNVFHVDSLIDDWSAPVESRIHPPIERWIRGFMDAKFVVTDSFHGCVFSIIFGIPFVVIGNVSRGMTRFNSLLQLFGMEDHLLSEQRGYNSGMDYSIPELAEETLQLMKQKSYSFLQTHLA